jgi:phage terminase large subunit-like protein
MTNPTKQVNFKTKHLNVWEDSETTFIDSKVWDAGSIPESEPAKLHMAEAYGGLDLASGFDFTALVLNMQMDGFTWFKSFFWIPEARLKEHAENNPSILMWAKQGFIQTIPGEVMDWPILAKAIMAIYEQYKIKGISYDRYKADHGLIQNLIHLGMPVDKLDPFSQAVTNMDEPTKEFERRAISGQVKHFGNPVLKWMLSNVTIFVDSNGNKKPNRTDSRKKKIDGIVAAIMAIGEELSMKGSSARDNKTVRIRKL